MKKSIRLRYLCSFLLIVMIPITIFCIFSYIYYLYNTKTQLDQNRQTAFRQASTQTNYMLSEIENAVLRLSSNLQELVEFSDPFTAVPNESSIISELDSYEKVLSSGLRLGFYIRGDTNLYLSDGKCRYSEFEQQLSPGLGATMSGLFSKMNVMNSPYLFAMDHRYTSAAAGSTDIYVIPVPHHSTKPTCTILCLIPENTVEAIFENIMGGLQGNLYLYKTLDNIIYDDPSPGLTDITFEDVRMIKGIGVMEKTISGRDCMILRNVSGKNGLTCMLVMDKADYFDTDSSSTQILCLLALFLTGLCILLAVMMAQYNYRPIKNLLADISGGEGKSLNENELNLIRNIYYESREKNRKLETQIAMQNNIARDQFLLRLIQGKCRDKEEADYFSVCLDMPIDFSHYLVLVGSIPKVQEHRYVVDQILELGKSHQFGSVQVLVVEAGLEEQILCICGFDLPGEPEEDPRSRIAGTVFDYYTGAGISHVIWGVSLITDSLFSLHQSYIEAAAALQNSLWRDLQPVYYYEPEAEPENGEFTIPTMRQSLLIESIRHGDLQTAMSSLDVIISQIEKASGSLLVKQILCFDLLNVIWKTIHQLNLDVDFNLNEHKDTFRSLPEFHQRVTNIITSVCGQVELRRERNNTQIKNDVIRFIHKNYCSSTFSLDYISDEMQLSKARITSIIKEDLDLSFGQYIINLRLNEVKRQLVETDKKIQDIVTGVGYLDVSNFARKFKNEEGVTPGQFRLLHRK